MVCDSCQSKVSKIIVPDKWKDGARNTVAFGAVKGTKTNKALAAKKQSAQWIPSENTCRLCKSKTLVNMHFCNDCAHKKGICSMCGKKVVDVSSHRMSLT
jgi:hypothetical protein